MTENPFEALGGAGGFDLQGLLQQAQQMQEQLESAQERLAEARVDGTAGGGAVTVTVNGVGELEAVTIKPGIVGGASEDDLSDLGDLVVAAYRDAKAQADAMAGSAIGPLTGGAVPGLGGSASGEDPDAGPGALGFSPEPQQDS
jgi:DNA-binding YbaB/EbfC family protein